MNLSEAQANFNQLLATVDAQTLPSFLKWVQSTSESTLEEKGETNEDKILSQICEDIRTEIPRDATLPSEKIVFPQSGENADLDPQTTVHVDAFLYPEEVVDDLCDEGRMSRNFCTKCLSHDTSPLNFISHSISRSQLKFMFQFLLPDLRGKTVLDVGSRLGAVLYGGFYYSAAANIVGVEMNADLCALQTKMVEKYQLQNKVKVICADICTQIEVLQAADVIILHNVFEFFMPVDAQTKIWQCLRDTVKRAGVLLVTSPSLQQSTEELQISLDDWVEELPTETVLKQASLSFYGNEESKDSDLCEIFLYRVR